MLAQQDINESEPRAVWANIRLGYGMKRIPRKAKKRLLREWRFWKAVRR